MEHLVVTIMAQHEDVFAEIFWIYSGVDKCIYKGVDHILCATLTYCVVLYNQRANLLGENHLGHIRDELILHYQLGSKESHLAALASEIWYLKSLHKISSHRPDTLVVPSVFFLTL